MKVDRGVNPVSGSGYGYNNNSPSRATSGGGDGGIPKPNPKTTTETKAAVDRCQPLVVNGSGIERDVPAASTTVETAVAA